MITINLLPEELKKEERAFTKISFSLEGKGKSFKNLAIAAVLILAAVHVSLFFMNTKSSKAYKALSQKNMKLAPSKKEYETLKAEAEISKKKATSIDELMANRFSWAKKLNDLSESMTQGIWLTELSYQENSTEIPVQVKAPPGHPGSKKDAMMTEMKKVTLRYLNISGFASSMGEQGTALIGKFIKNMKDNQSFFSDFSEIKLESIKSEKILDQEVMSFKIICQFNT